MTFPQFMNCAAQLAKRTGFARRNYTEITLQASRYSRESFNMRMKQNLIIGLYSPP